MLWGSLLLNLGTRQKPGRCIEYTEDIFVLLSLSFYCHLANEDFATLEVKFAKPKLLTRFSSKRSHRLTEAIFLIFLFSNLTQIACEWRNEMRTHELIFPSRTERRSLENIRKSRCVWVSFSFFILQHKILNVSTRFHGSTAHFQSCGTQSKL